MHEMSLAEGILAIVEQQRAQSPFGCVKSIELEIGELAGVELESLLFSLDAVFKHSVADGAEVRVERLPGLAHCFNCDSEVPLSRRGESCPRCGGFQLHLIGGSEMRVKSLEVE
ncbi:hydrogenase maturation nickel metallochaperone HypA/HybF [Ferrimonas marina]|uniref:Hydrogenase maturation factor HypA n=1 Tax=Ferrimonas marina TaxID=299255 RepID=A0A1M5VFZ1_9GAMM|nr:hydrogenase maturation nickel metallochaperone HypA [Ferrimonas marina]SHH74095.1 hydrogenase nickel incorporation protein HypA/HybF [Ferrimonas marina]